MQRNDVVHLLLLLASLAAAYVLPFELILLSYAILGPAHYFTEISWLHDRGYFLPHRAIAGVLAVAALAAMFMPALYWSGVLLWCVFLGAAIAATATTVQRAALYGVLAAAFTLLLMSAGMPFTTAGVLLPTLVHVSLFTLVFMTLGALRSGNKAQLALVGLYLAALVLIVIVPPWTGSVIPALEGIAQQDFGAVAPALGSLFGVPDLKFGGRVTGLLSFVYTYHYLNWFIKADVIKWANIPRGRLLAIVAASAASTALYFYNYAIGFLVLAVISLAHVLLEFPLNAISIGQLGSLALGRKPKRAPA